MITLCIKNLSQETSHADVEQFFQWRRHDDAVKSIKMESNRAIIEFHSFRVAGEVIEDLHDLLEDWFTSDKPGYPARFDLCEDSRPKPAVKPTLPNASISSPALATRSLRKRKKSFAPDQLEVGNNYTCRFCTTQSPDFGMILSHVKHVHKSNDIFIGQTSN